MRQLGQSQGYPDCHMAFLVLKYSLLYIEKHTLLSVARSQHFCSLLLPSSVVKLVELAFLRQAFFSFPPDPCFNTRRLGFSDDCIEVLRHPQRLWCSLQFHGPTVVVRSAGNLELKSHDDLKFFHGKGSTKDESAVVSSK